MSGEAIETRYARARQRVTAQRRELRALNKAMRVWVTIATSRMYEVLWLREERNARFREAPHPNTWHPTWGTVVGLAVLTFVVGLFLGIYIGKLVPR